MFIKLKKLKILFIFIICILMCNFLYANILIIKIGVLAKRGHQKCFKTWSPTAAYLTDNIPGINFIIVPIDFDDMYLAVKNAEVDFILSNSSFYVELESGYGVTRIATLKNRNSKGIFTQFGGVIFCKKTRKDILRLNDLKGKSFMAVKATSVGGWRAAWRELKEVGIDPYKDFTSLSFGGTHDAVVYSVRDGKVDAGTIRTDILEQMQAEGKINITDFYIMHCHGENDFHLPFQHSTRAYPEWPFAKLKHISNELAEKVSVALINMPLNSDALSVEKYAGWTIPLSYQPVHECLKELRVGPYMFLLV